MWNPIPVVNRSTAVASIWRTGARILEALGAEEHALRLIDRAMALAPRRRDLHLQATRLCLKRGRLDRAAVHWKKAAGEQYKAGFMYWLKRTNHHPLYKEHFIQRTAIKMDYYQDTETESDIEKYSPLKSPSGKCHNPGNINLNDVGINLLQTGKCEEALVIFRQLEVQGNTEPAVFLNIGLALSKLNRHQEALDYYQKVQASGLNSVELYNNKGFSLYHLGRFEEAIACYELAQQMSIRDISVLSNLASCYQRVGLHQQAMSCYQKALCINPDDVTVLNNYALCLDETGSHEEAADMYNKALLLDPENKNVLLNSALCCINLKRYQRSMEIFDQILASDPDCQETWGLRGNLLCELGCHHEAAQCYSKALGLFN